MNTNATETMVLQILERCQRDPLWFFAEVLGDDPWAVQQEIILSVLRNKRTAVKSCNGAGKTWLAARVALWGLLTHFDARVITTAPTARQVERLLWGEISTAWRKLQQRWPGLFPGRLYEIPVLQISKSWYAMGFSTNDPNAMQGVHAPFVLIILDEAGGNKGGVAAPMWEPIDGNLVGENCHLLAIGNPTDPSSPFYLECRNPATRVYTISAFQTPNFTTYGITRDDIVAGEAIWKEKITGPLPKPELTTPEAVSDAYRKYGEQSTYWQARVLGQFPEQGTDTLLWMSWVADAQERWEVPQGDAPATSIDIGVDVAAGGENETVISAFAWMGAASIPRQVMLRATAQGDTTKTRDLVLAAALELHTRNPDALISVRIDADGVGKGVHDMVAEHVARAGWTWLTVIAIRSGHTAADPERYLNTRAQYWWAIRERFEDGRIAILDDDVQASQLTSIKWRETSAQRKIQIEPKEEAEKRGVKSPDRADALMFALAPVAAASGTVAMSASGQSQPRHQSSFRQRLAKRR